MREILIIPWRGRRYKFSWRLNSTEKTRLRCDISLLHLRLTNRNDIEIHMQVALKILEERACS